METCSLAMSSAPNLLQRVGTSPTVPLLCARRWRARGVCVSNAKLGLEPKLRNRFGVLLKPSPKAPSRSRALCPTNATGLVGYLRCQAHQTCCDVSGRARPSRWRARGVCVSHQLAVPVLFCSSTEKRQIPFWSYLQLLAPTQCVRQDFLVRKLQNAAAGYATGQPS